MYPAYGFKYVNQRSKKYVQLCTSNKLYNNVFRIVTL